MPFACGLAGGKVESRAKIAASEAGSVDRAFIPVGRLFAIHALQHILLAAGRSARGVDAVPEQPRRRPEALRFRYLRAELKTPIAKAEQPLRLEPRRSVNAMRGLARHNVQVAVGSHIGVGLGSAAWRDV